LLAEEVAEVNIAEEEQEEASQAKMGLLATGIAVILV